MLYCQNLFNLLQIRMDTPSGLKDSIPAWIKYSVQYPGDIPYTAIYYDPPEDVLSLSLSHVLAFIFSIFISQIKKLTVLVLIICA